jgi:threonine dehydratase
MVGAKLLVEPSAAVPLAALLAGSLELRGRRVGVVLSGGNVDLDGLPW